MCQTIYKELASMLLSLVVLKNLLKTCLAAFRFLASWCLKFIIMHQLFMVTSTDDVQFINRKSTTNYIKGNLLSISGNCTEANI